MPVKTLKTRKPVTRVYSAATRDALRLIGLQIRRARKERRMTAQDLADRIGVARSTLHRIEKGDARAEIGIVFEAAVLVGVALYHEDSRQLSLDVDRYRDKIALLPAARRPRKALNDEF